MKTKAFGGIAIRVLVLLSSLILLFVLCASAGSLQLSDHLDNQSNYTVKYAAFNNGAVKSTTTWTVDDSGGVDFTRIQDAINASNPGDTIEVRSGTYYENVNIDKQLVLRGIDTGAGKPLVAAGGSGSVITISADGCVLNGFNVTGSGSNWGYAGIKIRSEDNEIVNNTCTHNINGIFFEEPYSGGHTSNNNTVTNNTVCHNNEKGIYVYRSHQQHSMP
jgi:nitrous oxidase accessory protein NosD